MSTSAPPTLLDSVAISRAEALGLNARYIMEGYLAGEHKSPDGARESQSVFWKEKLQVWKGPQSSPAGRRKNPRGCKRPSCQPIQGPPSHGGGLGNSGFSQRELDRARLADLLRSVQKLQRQETSVSVVIEDHPFAHLVALGYFAFTQDDRKRIGIFVVNDFHDVFQYVPRSRAAVVFVAIAGRRYRRASSRSTKGEDNAYSAL